MSPSVFGRLLVHIPSVLTSVHRPAAVANFLSLLISCPKVLSPWNSYPDKGPQSLGQLSYGPQSVDWLSCLRSLVHIPAVLMSSFLGPAVLRSSVHGPAVLKFSVLAPAVLTSVHRHLSWMRSSVAQPFTDSTTHQAVTISFHLLFSSLCPGYPTSWHCIEYKWTIHNYASLITEADFDVLLTMQLSIILAIDQLNAQILVL